MICLIKIGIITNKKFIKHQAKPLLKYLRKRVDVSLYIEEEFLLKSVPKYYFDEDLFFVKGKGEIILGLVKLIEKTTNVQVINPFRAIWLAMNRFLNSTYLKKAGINLPDFSLTPDAEKPPFKDFIIKNIIDQKSSSFQPSIQITADQTQISDQRAIKDAKGEEQAFHYYFYQQYIKSQWEYKIYGIDDKLFYFQRVPSIKNPHKILPKIQIEKIPELEDVVFKIMETLNLKVTSVDFLKSKDGQYFLIDVNSSPNINNVPNGAKLVGELLINQIIK